MNIPFQHSQQPQTDSRTCSKSSLSFKYLAVIIKSRERDLKPNTEGRDGILTNKGNYDTPSCTYTEGWHTFEMTVSLCTHKSFVSHCSQQLLAYVYKPFYYLYKLAMAYRLTSPRLTKKIPHQFNYQPTTTIFSRSKSLQSSKSSTTMSSLLIEASTFVT